MTDDHEIRIGLLPAYDVDELVDHLTDTGIKRDAISVAVLDRHDGPSVNRDNDPRGKYQTWANALFEGDSRTLREPVYFWTRAWREDDTSSFYGFETSLELLEYYLIDPASDLYPEHMLNTEGGDCRGYSIGVTQPRSCAPAGDERLR